MKRFAMILVAAATLIGGTGVAMAQHGGGHGGGGGGMAGGMHGGSAGAWHGGGNWSGGGWHGGGSWHGGSNWHGGWGWHGTSVVIGIGGPWWGWCPAYYP